MCNSAAQAPFIPPTGGGKGIWGIILNLLGLLLGFAVLSKIFEESHVPDILPRYLPDDWKGPFLLLVFIFILSSFLDNIAAALTVPSAGVGTG
jgi:Na+/H+ antiporter NhaD/arsenite permease-like protein